MTIDTGSTPDRTLFLRLAVTAAIRSGDARRLRVDAGISVAEVARHLCVKPETVGRWESGKRQPTAEHLLRYAEVLRLLQEVSDDPA